MGKHYAPSSNNVQKTNFKHKGQSQGQKFCNLGVSWNGMISGYACKIQNPNLSSLILTFTFENKETDITKTHVSQSGGLIIWSLKKFKETNKSWSLYPGPHGPNSKRVFALNSIPMNLWIFSVLGKMVVCVTLKSISQRRLINLLIHNDLNRQARQQLPWNLCQTNFKTQTQIFLKHDNDTYHVDLGSEYWTRDIQCFLWPFLPVSSQVKVIYEYNSLTPTLKAKLTSHVSSEIIK